LQFRRSSLEALFARAKSLSTVLKNPQLYTALAPYVKTDLTYDDIVNLASLASDVSLES
jgi:anionic cell wall polymer biosynthesis LytR-Cps2A-Psr (LCP) family protein